MGDSLGPTGSSIGPVAVGSGSARCFSCSRSWPWPGNEVFGSTASDLFLESRKWRWAFRRCFGLGGSKLRRGEDMLTALRVCCVLFLASIPLGRSLGAVTQGVGAAPGPVKVRSADELRPKTRLERDRAEFFDFSGKSVWQLSQARRQSSSTRNLPPMRQTFHSPGPILPGQLAR